jgi:hypothetical protein
MRPALVVEESLVQELQFPASLCLCLAQQLAKAPLLCLLLLLLLLLLLGIIVFPVRILHLLDVCLLLLARRNPPLLQLLLPRGPGPGGIASSQRPVIAWAKLGVLVHTHL